MNAFPMTTLGGIEVSRMIAGTNWFLGFSHQTHARSEWIKKYHSRDSMADVLEVFLREGINVAMGFSPTFSEAVREAEQRVGRKMYVISAVNWPLEPGNLNLDAAREAFDQAAEIGVTFCWPHSCATDRLYDGWNRTIRHMDELCREIRQREMIPGLSTHLPECIVAADRMGLDVASYICIYNAAGFLMNIEIDWVQKVIRDAKRPVTTIKPMAAGRLMPYVGLPFSWSTLRDCDLVTVGTMTPDEAAECIEISRATLEHRAANVQLQTTRSKQTFTETTN